MKHRFVEYIPSKIESDTLYISIEYKVAKHLCACGCGDEIVTSISPTGWTLIYNGDNVTLYPSIGNWTHKCKSHYYIKKDKIVWLKNNYSKSEIKEFVKNDTESRVSFKVKKVTYSKQISNQEK